MQTLSSKLKKIFSPINILTVFLGVVFSLVIILVHFLFQDVNLVQSSTYEILPGSTSREIAYDLAEKQIITNPFLFNLYLKLKDLDKELQAGEFTLPKENISLRDFVNILTSAGKPQEIQITILEGYTVEQIANLLAYRNLVDQQEFVNVAEKEKFALEGYLFPDTYRFYKDVPAKQIIQKMLDNFQNKIKPLLPAIEESNYTLEQVVIMASILEREVQSEQDMRLVSDILRRRLEANYPLELCSTLNYVLDKEERLPALTHEQLKIDSPYNTYKYQGLPPTPISNPGLKAIKAVLNPEVNQFWFYLSKPDGETVFSKTYEEHLKNKVKYLK